MNHCAEQLEAFSIGIVTVDDLSLLEYDGMMLINGQINKLERERLYKMKQESKRSGRRL